MSEKFYATMKTVGEAIAAEFAAGGDGKRRHVTCRCDDMIYVYLHVDGVHVQTEHVDIPEAWWDHWPTDATVRRYIRRQCRLGGARITDLDA